MSVTSSNAPTLIPIHMEIFLTSGLTWKRW
jgi:hypothetical protein